MGLTGVRVPLRARCSPWSEGVTVVESGHQVTKGVATAVGSDCLHAPPVIRCRHRRTSWRWPSQDCAEISSRDWPATPDAMSIARIVTADSKVTTARASAGSRVASSTRPIHQSSSPSGKSHSWWACAVRMAMPKRTASDDSNVTADPRRPSPTIAATALAAAIRHPRTGARIGRAKTLSSHVTAGRDAFKPQRVHHQPRPGTYLELRCDDPRSLTLDRSRPRLLAGRQEHPHAASRCFERRERDDHCS
jgi:hypothetical protein